MQMPVHRQALIRYMPLLKYANQKRVQILFNLNYNF
jgi:hypothetical protein